MFDRVVLYLTPFQLKFNTFREGFQTTAQIGFIFLGRVAVGFRFLLKEWKTVHCACHLRRYYWILLLLMRAGNITIKYWKNVFNYVNRDGCSLFVSKTSLTKVINDYEQQYIQPLRYSPLFNLISKDLISAINYYYMLIVKLIYFR